MQISEKQKKLWYKDVNFWFGFIGIVAFVFSIYTYLFPGEPDIKFYMLDNTSILDVKEEVSKLNITYDSINLLESEMDISIILLQVKNDGDKNITVGEYDPSIPFGITMAEGKILKKPELISSSENEYYNDIILKFDDKSADFKYKLIDKDKFFNLKILVLHKKGILPVITPRGKISGVKKMSITNIIKSKDEEDLKSKKRIMIYLSLGSLMLGLMLFLIRNQRSLIFKLNNRVETLTIINEQLSNEILRNPKSSLESETPLEDEGNILTFDEILNLKSGDLVLHQKFGKGEVINVRVAKTLKDSTIAVKFEEGGVKRLMIRFAILQSGS